jgi:hypothetical protein
MSLKGFFKGSSVMTGLPSIRVIDPRQPDQKKNQGSNTYNEATSASRNAKMTAEQSMLTIGSREVSYNAISSRIWNNLSSVNLNPSTIDDKTKAKSTITGLHNL